MNRQETTMLKELIKDKAQIHTRQISLSTHPHENGMVLVRGELEDRRHVPIVDILGRPKDPGIIHHMTLILAIAPDPLRIADAEAEMSTVPMDECQSCLDRVNGLKGLEIKSGFSKQVGKIMGGTRGCTHLCSLARAMAVEALHGWLTQKRAQKDLLPPSMAQVNDAKFLKNSCRIWREDGPRIRQMARAVAESSRP